MIILCSKHRRADWRGVRVGTHANIRVTSGLNLSPEAGYPNWSFQYLFSSCRKTAHDCFVTHPAQLTSLSHPAIIWYMTYEGIHQTNQDINTGYDTYEVKDKTQG
jgi:hypothetical protein